jgi:hypothetical protein
MNDSTPISSAWLKPNSVDPTLLVDRELQRRDLREMIQDPVRNELRSVRILVVGDRGAGKSILTRAVLADLQRDDSQVVGITIDARSIQYRSLLDHLASALGNELLRSASDVSHAQYKLAFAQLAMLAYKNKLTRSEAVAVASSYGVAAGVGGGSIVDLVASLDAKFTWQRTKTDTSTHGDELLVTEALLEDAIRATLVLLERHRLPWHVVLFYDDLDQAIPEDSERSLESLFRRVLDMGPCIAVVHLRTEALIDNVAREFDQTLEVPRLDDAAMMQMLTKRQFEATPVVRQELDRMIGAADLRKIERLASVAPSALSLLHWVNGLLRRARRLPLPPEWCSDEWLDAIARTYMPYPGDAKELAQLVTIFDATVPAGSRWVPRDRLSLRQSDGDQLSAASVERLERAGVLLPRFRFQPTGELLLQPTYELLRPSVKAKLRAV